MLFRSFRYSLLLAILSGIIKSVLSFFRYLKFFSQKMFSNIRFWCFMHRFLNMSGLKDAFLNIIFLKASCDHLYIIPSELIDSPSVCLVCHLSITNHLIFKCSCLILYLIIHDYFIITCSKMTLNFCFMRSIVIILRQIIFSRLCNF